MRLWEDPGAPLPSPPQEQSPVARGMEGLGAPTQPDGLQAPSKQLHPPDEASSFLTSNTCSESNPK